MQKVKVEDSGIWVIVLVLFFGFMFVNDHLEDIEQNTHNQYQELIRIDNALHPEEHATDVEHIDVRFPLELEAPMEEGTYEMKVRMEGTPGDTTVKL